MNDFKEFSNCNELSLLVYHISMETDIPGDVILCKKFPSFFI